MLRGIKGRRTRASERTGERASKVRKLSAQGSRSYEFKKEEVAFSCNRMKAEERQLWDN